MPIGVTRQTQPTLLPRAADYAFFFAKATFDEFVKSQISPHPNPLPSRAAQALAPREGEGVFSTFYEFINNNACISNMVNNVIYYTYIPGFLEWKACRFFKKDEECE